jgi:hypothetical protein
MHECKQAILKVSVMKMRHLFTIYLLPNSIRCERKVVAIVVVGVAEKSNYTSVNYRFLY